MKNPSRIHIAVTLFIIICLGLLLLPKASLHDRSGDELSDTRPSSGSLERADDSLQNGRVGHPEPDTEEALSARATLRGSRDELEMASLDGEFARVLAEPGDTFEITIRSARFARGAPVRIDADNGGTLNRRLGPIKRLMGDRSGEFSFSYSLGGHRGLYTVEVSQGEERELFEFWVGPEPPLGDPGPTRTFSSPSPRS